MAQDYRLGPRPRASRTKRARNFALTALVVTTAAFVWLTFERSAPTAELLRPIAHVGRGTVIPIVVRDEGTGLASVEISIESSAGSRTLELETFPRTGWRGSDVHERHSAVAVKPIEMGIAEGPARLVVRATDHSWWNLFRHPTDTLVQAVEVDTTPPSIEVLTTQHYLRVGGSDFVVFRAAPDTVTAAVEVGAVRFPATRGVLRDGDLYVATFAVLESQGTDAEPVVTAEDRAGNRREQKFVAGVRSRDFREREIQLPKDFVATKIPDLLRANRMPVSEDPVANYLAVNRDLRAESERRIRAACATSVPRPLWTRGFLRQPGSASLSLFADRRAYIYENETIDRQTHLGYDLASLRRSPIVAGNDGVVTFADAIGIYGQTVIIDHGLGLFSLYGHLSSIIVEPGQTLVRGDTIGRSGESGLAGGDHLHFSVMLHGHHVDPVEWWDEKWVRNHILDRIADYGGRAEVP